LTSYITLTFDGLQVGEKVGEKRGNSTWFDPKIRKRIENTPNGWVLQRGL
jgi:hypothetical protein